MNTFSNTTRGHTQTNIGKHWSIQFPAKHYWLSFTGDEMELDGDKLFIQDNLSRMNHNQIQVSWLLVYHIYLPSPSPLEFLSQLHIFFFGDLFLFILGRK